MSIFDTDKGVMTSNDVREECLQCHMTSNDVKGECYITMMTGRCVNIPDQIVPVGCYENYFKVREMCVNKAIISYISFACFA